MKKILEMEGDELVDLLRDVFLSQLLFYGAPHMPTLKRDMDDSDKEQYFSPIEFTVNFHGMKFHVYRSGDEVKFISELISG
jgi:hypothetical protein